MAEISIARQAGSVIREARKRAGLTQADLAQRAGVSTRLVSGLELGDNSGIQLDKLLGLLHSLGLVLEVREKRPLEESPSAAAQLDVEEKAEPSNNSEHDESLNSLWSRYQDALKDMESEARE